MTLPIKPRGVALAFAVAILAAPGASALAQPSDPQAGYGAQQQPRQYNQGQYDEQRRAYDAQYGEGAYERAQHDQDRAARHECHREKRDDQAGGAVAGGVAGALIGGALGRGTGAVVGGVGGAVAGSAIAGDQTHC